MIVRKKYFLAITVIILLAYFFVNQNDRIPRAKNSIIHSKGLLVKKRDTSKILSSFSSHKKSILNKLSSTLDTNSYLAIEREKYSNYLRNHPFNNKNYSEIKNEKNIDKDLEKDRRGIQEENETDNPELAWKQDFLRTMDPKLKRPTPELLPAIVQKNYSALESRQITNSIPGTASAPWIERGPNNVGGRTRALVWDPNDITGKKVWAAGVTGGLWYNNDITSATSSWNKVNDFWANISVTCIAFDPNNSLIAYAGTGEVSANPSIGGGIWKTTDGGNTWNQITSTINFSYINDIVVRNENGSSKIYAAVDANYNKGVWHNLVNAGLKSSSNGGATWTQSLPKIPSTTINFVPASISIGKDNRIWVGTKASPIWATDMGGGRVLYSDNGTSWVISDAVSVTNGKGRVTVACAPSNSNYVYSFVEDNNQVSAIRKTTNSGSSWVSVTKPIDADTDIPANDFSRGQAWYDQVLKVDPNNPNVVIVGAIDLFRSTNGGASWNQISRWSRNNNLNKLTNSIVHADQHAIAFKPGSSSTVIFGNDGGVYYTTSISSAATSNVITERNNNYNVTQFYSAAINPEIGSNNYLAGAQDNGTQQFNSQGINTTNEVYGGDGGYCFIDQNNPSYQIASYVKNNFYLSTDGGNSFDYALLEDDNTGSFINPACYDNNKHILYTYKSYTENSSILLYRVSGITTTPSSSTITIKSGTSSSDVTAFKVSPYTLNSTTLFIGLNTGHLLKVTGADASNNPVVKDITGTLPVGSISCIEIGSSENELLVTFFNYGISKIWYTSNGGITWLDKSGNFPNMPVRWALFNPNNRTNEVILATELGVFGSLNFSASSPNWTQSNTGFANVRTDMLQMRNSDYQVIAATHGRGLFSSNGFVANGVQSPTITSFSPSSAGVGQTVTITGTNFTGTTAVSFGGINASSYTVVSSNLISAVVGIGATGSVNVITPGGNANKTGFIFSNLTPTISSFTPVSAEKGSRVNITGTNFTGATKVSFGDSLAASFIVNSSTNISAIVGEGMSGNITVTTPYGIATKGTFNYLAKADLICSNISILTPNVNIGGNLLISFRIKNIGNATSSPSHCAVYLNSSSGPYPLTEVSTPQLLPNQETSDVVYSFTIPYDSPFSSFQNVPIGTNYITVLANSRGEEPELNISNNQLDKYGISISATPIYQQHLPYPIIFVHGLNSDASTWQNLIDTLPRFYGYSYGGNMNFCLNQDGNIYKSNATNDYKNWTVESDLKKADFYTVNFSVNQLGNSVIPSNASGSNQSGIVKQGLAIKDAIKHVLKVTGRDKVILVGHSMGGLANREYLQNIKNWQSDTSHHVAKYLSVGTPHGGSNITGLVVGSILINLFTGMDEKSEAVRDLRTDYAVSGLPGVYLFGGKEAYSVMDNSLIPFWDYNNVDVNCNGIDADQSQIVGLNYKAFPLDLKYSSVIGMGSISISSDGGDGVVSAISQNLNNYTYATRINADTFVTVRPVNSSLLWHSEEPKQWYEIMQGLDEPASSNFAYNIKLGNRYFGNFTIQSLATQSPYNDSDTYSFNIPKNGLLHFTYNNIPVNSSIDFINSNSTKIFPTINTVYRGSIDTLFAINSGLYKMTLSGLADAKSWKNPYSFKLNFQTTIKPVLAPHPKDTMICSSSPLVLNAPSGYIGYRWNTSDTSRTISVNKAGSYYCSVMDSSGYWSLNSDTVNVTLDTLPTLPLTLSQSALSNVCVGSQQITLSSTSGYFYQWQKNDTIINNATSQTYNPTSTGFYKMKLYSKNKICSFISDSLKVSILNSVTRIFNSDTIKSCGINYVALDAGAGYNSYLWSTGAITPAINVTQTGLYKITAYCGASSSNNIFGQFSSSNNSTKYITIPDAPQLHFTNQMSLLFKTRIEGSYANSNTLIDKGSNTGYQITLNGLSSSLNFWYPNIDNSIGLKYTLTSSQVQNSDWFYVGVVKRADSSFFYINGNLVDKIKTTNPIPVNTSNITIGASNGGASGKYSGSMDNISLWNRALSQSEISNYSECMTGKESGCVAYYNFENNSNYTLVTDNSIFGNNGVQNASINTYPNSQIVSCSPVAIKDSVFVSIINSKILQKDTSICIGEGVSLSIPISSSSYGCSASGLPISIQNGLVAYYPFCSNPNNVLGGNYNGTLNGAVLTKDRFGNANNAFDFNGSSSNIIIPNGFTSANSNEFTVSMWVNLRQINDNNSRALFYCGNGEYIIAYDNDNIGFSVKLSDGNWSGFVNADCSKLLNSWIFVTAQYKKGNYTKLYINGELSSTSSIANLDLFVPGLNSYIGSAYPSANRYANASIDDILIHNRILSKTEINSLIGNKNKILWSTGDTASSIFIRPIVSNKYWVKVDNGVQNCIDSVYITVNAIDTTIGIVGNTTICNGDSALLIAGFNAASYQWLKNNIPIVGAIKQNLSVNSAGDYRVVVSNVNGCSDTSRMISILVNQTPLAPVITANGNTTFCYGNSVVLTSNSNNSQWILNGAKLNGSIGISDTAKLTGNYTAVNINNGCISAASNTISVTVNPTPLKPVIIASDSTKFCAGGKVILTSSSTEENQWFLNGNMINGAKYNSDTVTVAGSYTVVATLNGCSSSVSMPVNVIVHPLPIVTITTSGNTNICEGDSVKLTSSTGTKYNWYYNNLLLSNATSQALYAKLNGDYVVNITDSNSCSSTAKITIIVNKVPNGSIQNPSNNFICDGNSIILKTGGAYTYQWFNGQIPIIGAIDSSYTASSAGVYSVKYTSLFGCNSKSSNTVSLSLVKKPKVDFSFNPRCINMPVTFKNLSDTVNSDKIKWMWNLAQGSVSNLSTPTKIYTLPGTYNITLTAISSNCPSLFDSTSKQLIIEPHIVGVNYPIINAKKSTQINLAARKIGAIYNWMPSTGLNNPQISNPIAILSNEQQYKINITTAGGCNIVDSQLVRIFAGYDIFVPSGFSPDGDGVNDILRPILVGIKELRYFKVLNRWGQSIYQTSQINVGWDGTFKSMDQPSDTYIWLVEAIDENGEIIRKSGKTTLIR